MNNITHTDLAPEKTPWAIRWQSIAQNRVWLVLLLAVGSTSSVVYPHPPLVAFGAIAGTTLTPQKALGATTAIWLVNQIFGYGLRQYPQTVESLGWAIAMGIGALLIAGFASLRPQFSQATFKGHCLWVLAIAVAGFVMFEGIILSLGFLLTGSHVFTWETLGSLFSKEMIWTAALAGVYGAIARYSR
jgi:hypothetical protein